MNENLFKISTAFVAVVFTTIFCYLIIPPFIQNPDLVNAFGGGFVNPYASGYSIDVFCCWFILLIWVIYESPKIRYGWICLILGIIPGVAVGFALYLIIRTNQLRDTD